MEARFCVFRIGHGALRSLGRSAAVGCALLTLSADLSLAQSAQASAGSASRTLLVGFTVPARLTLRTETDPVVARAASDTLFVVVPVEVGANIPWRLVVSGPSADLGTGSIEVLDSGGSWRVLGTGDRVSVTPQQAPTEPMRLSVQLRMRGAATAGTGWRRLRMELEPTEGALRAP